MVKRRKNPELHRISRTVLAALAGFLLGCPAASAQELDIINRPVNIHGMSGLIETSSPYTLPPHTIEVGLAALSEQSAVPDLSFNQMPLLTISYGASSSSEVAFRTSYIHTTTDQEAKQRGAGDAELSWKWIFLEPKETSSTPGAGLFLTAIVPLTRKNEAAIGGVAHWGAKLGITLGRELYWGDQLLGLYADGQIIVRDLTDDLIRDRYTMANLGLLLPISKNRNLQVIAEYGATSGVDKPTTDTIDHTVITFGLRLVTERLNITIGTQFLRKHEEGFENSSRVIADTGFKF